MLKYILLITVSSKQLFKNVRLGYFICSLLTLNGSKIYHKPLDYEAFVEQHLKAVYILI